MADTLSKNPSRQQAEVRGIYLVRKWLGFDRNVFANALGLSPNQYAQFERLGYIPEKLRQSLLVRIQVLAGILGIVPEILLTPMSLREARRQIGRFNQLRARKLQCEVNRAILRITALEPKKHHKTLRKDLRQIEQLDCSFETLDSREGR